MSIDKKISNLIDNQFPDFVRDEGPNLVAFVKAYYEYLEQEGKVLEQNRNLLNYKDIDQTLDQYIRFFQQEVMSDIPLETLTDKRQLVKKIKDLYTSKGSQRSYELLFRILYNEDIDFFYPGQVILRASDGRWTKEQSLNAIIISGQATDLISKTITGQTSGATARVEDIVTTISSGIEVTEILLTNVVGTFISGETIVDSDILVTAEVFSTIGPLQAVNITFGGRGHLVGDDVSITSPTGFGSTGSVSETSDTTAIELFVINGGSGYRLESEITIVGGSGSGASANVGSLSNTSILPINTDIIQPMANVVLNTGPTFVSLGANTDSVSANLASANISSTLISGLRFANTTIGSIASVITNNPGFGYDTAFPTITVFDPLTGPLNIPDPLEPGDILGRDGTIGARFVDGAMTAIIIPDGQRGQGYRTFDLATITNNSRSAFNASGNPIVTGVIDKPGRYTDTKGFLSGDNVLQDNFFYQEYSYVIKSKQFIDTYRRIVNNILHPSGVKLFGEYQINNTIDVTSAVEPAVFTTVRELPMGEDTFDSTSTLFDSTGNFFSNG